MNTVLTETPVTETGTVVPILSINQRAALLECESIVRHGLKAFVEVGHALARIRDEKLYREKFGTFEAYCLATWDISDRHARNLWTAAEVVDELAAHQFAVLPETESQARPLAKLPKVEWVPAWEEVLGTAPSGKVTARHIEAVAERRKKRLRPTAPVAIENPTAKLEARSPVDAGTRAERILAAYQGTISALRGLQDLIPAGDGGAVHVATAINCVDSFQEHFHAVQRLKGYVEKSNGLKPDYIKRMAEQKVTEVTK